jgi:CRP-like cAMP-binding protein
VNSEHPLRANRLLALLSEAEFGRLEADLSIVELRHRQEIARAGDGGGTVHFPLTVVTSLIATDSEGGSVEMATVGREGVVGLPGIFGGGGMIGEVVAQIGGNSATIAAELLRTELAGRGALFQILGRYTVALLSQIGQSVMCIRRHPVDSRAARWLLATQDRVGRDEFGLTQDFLAIMLGVTRPQVSIAAGMLKRAGLIDYSRGSIAILDRPGLESAACECYGVIRSEFDRLLGDSNGKPWVPVGG